jgi:hypothetical protein
MSRCLERMMQVLIEVLIEVLVLGHVEDQQCQDLCFKRTYTRIYQRCTFPQFIDNLLSVYSSGPMFNV